MVETLQIRDEGCMSLAEYVAFINEKLDPDDFDSILETAWGLRALANDRRFLVETINDELKRAADRSLMNAYSRQSIRLGKGERFSVRANSWIPESADPLRRDAENGVFSYFDPHDHNYDFVTVGYHGPGYRTALYEYDASTIVGDVGEKVDLRFVEETELSEGKTMVYRRSADIHTQFRPRELSVSLNLLVMPRDIAERRQLHFDIATGTISRVPDTASTRRVLLVEMAAFLADDNTIDILSSLAATHPCSWTKRAAAQALVAPGER
jgi:hypothetical protein